MPDNRINIELNLQLVDTSNAVNKLAEFRAQLNGLGADVERVSRQQGYIGLRGVENTARSISQNIEEVRGSVVPNNERIDSVRQELAESRPRTTQLTVQENLSSASERLAEASKVVTQQYVQARTTPPLDLQTFISRDTPETLNGDIRILPTSKTSMFREEEYNQAKFTREGYAQVFNEEQNGSQGRVTAAYAKEQAQRTEIARSEGARRAQIAESEVTSIGRNVQRDVAIDDVESSDTNSTRRQTRRVLNNAIVLDTLDQNKVDKSYIQRAQQSIQEGERATFGPIVTAEAPRFFRPAEIARSQSYVRRMDRDREKDQPEVQPGPSSDILYTQQLAQAVERNRQREQAQREELFGTTTVETPELNPNANASERTERYNVRINAQDNLPDPVKIAAITAEIENLTAALNNMSAAQQKKDVPLVDTIKSEIAKKETELRDINAKKAQDPEVRADFERLKQTASTSDMQISRSAILRANKEFERGNIDAAKSILTVNNELERTTQQAQRSKVSLTTIGDIISGRSGSGRGPDAGRDFEKGGGYGGGGPPPIPPDDNGPNGRGRGGSRGRQEELNRTFGSGPEELGGFRAFRGINRMGALEIQAAIINSIQAGASGMSFGHIAMMEGAQVGGGLIQGGIVSFGQIISFLGTTAGMATAALVGLAAGITAIAYASSKADSQLAEAHNTAALQGRDAVKVERQTVDMASQIAKSGTLGREESRTSATTIQSIPNISEEARVSLGRSIEGISRLDYVGDIEKTKKGVAEVMSSIGQMKSYSEKNNLFGNNEGMRESFEAAAGIGDKLQASTIFAKALEERAKPTSEILKASREEMGTLARNLDIFETIQENKIRRMTGVSDGGFFSGAFFPTPRFQSGTEPVTETVQSATQASSRSLTVEREINGLLLQRETIQAGLREQPANPQYEQGLLETELKLRETRTPEEQRQRQVSQAILQTQVQSAQQTAQIDPSRASGIAAAAKTELDDIVAHEQSAAATRAGITEQLTAQRIEAEQRYRTAVLETQRIGLAAEISTMQVQRATRPADLAFQTQITETQFQTTVRNPAATQAQKDEKLIENIKAHQQEDLETQNVVITQLRANMALAEARGDLEEINRLRREENDIIQSRPDIRSRLERETSKAGVERGEIQNAQRQTGRQILQIDVERSLNSTDATFQRVALERQLDILIKGGLSTEEQRLQKIIEIVNAKRHERLEAENAIIAQSKQSESILRYREDIAGIVRLERERNSIIQSSRDRTDVDKIQSQTQLIQAQLQALRQSVQLEEQFVESSNRFTAQRVHTQTTLLNYRVETGELKPSQALQGEQGLSQKAFAEEEARLQTLLQDQNLQPTERARINSQLASLYEQDAQKQIELQTQITRAIRDENERRTANIKAFFKDIESGTTNAFASVITRQQTAADAVKQLRNSVITSFITNAEEMASKAAGKALAPSLGVNLKEGEDSSISSIFSKALGAALHLTTPEPKLDQAAVASKMEKAGDLQYKAAELWLKVAQSARNEASQAPLNAGTGRPPDTYTPTKNPPHTIAEIPREQYETKAQPGMIGGSTSTNTTRTITQAFETDNAIGEGTVSGSIINGPAASSDVGNKIAQTLKSRGWSDAAIQGTLNNAMTESSLNPQAKGAAGEIGLFQFHPSSHIKPFEQAYGGNWSPEAQTNYVADVVEKTMPDYAHSTDSRTATSEFLRGFEKPKDQSDRQLNDRFANNSTSQAITQRVSNNSSTQNIQDQSNISNISTAQPRNKIENKDFGSNINSNSTAVVSSVQNANPRITTSNVSSNQNTQNQLNNSVSQPFTFENLQAGGVIPKDAIYLSGPRNPQLVASPSTPVVDPATTTNNASVQNINPQASSFDVSSNQNVQNQLNSSTAQSNTQSSFSPVAFGDNISAHLIRKIGVEGQESGQVGVRNVGDTAVSGYAPKEVFDLLEKTPNDRIKGRDVVLSSGTSNDIDNVQSDFISKQITELKDREAKSITLLGVGRADFLSGRNEMLAKIAAESGVGFTGPLRSVATDQIHSSNNQDLFKQISESQTAKEVNNSSRDHSTLVDRASRVESSAAVNRSQETGYVSDKNVSQSEISTQGNTTRYNNDLKQVDIDKTTVERESDKSINEKNNASQVGDFGGGSQASSVDQKYYPTSWMAGGTGPTSTYFLDHSQALSEQKQKEDSTSYLMQLQQPRTVGDLLQQAAPRYKEVTGGQDISADFQKAWGHPIAEMPTAMRIQSALGDEQLKPIAMQANSAIQAANPGLDIESAFKAGKPSLDELLKLPVQQQQPLKIDSSSVAQGVVQGQQQANQQIGGSVSSTNIETNSAKQQSNSEIQQNNSETQQNSQELRQLNQNIQTIQNQKGATTSGGIGGGSISTTSTSQVDSANLQQQATIQQTSSSLDQLGISAATTQTNFDASSSSATTMGGSLAQTGQQAAQAGQQFAQVESSKLSGTTSGSGTTGGGGASSGGGLLSGVGELASVATAFSALTGTKVSPIIREVTAGISLISSVSKIFSSGGLLGGLFSGGGGGAASSGGAGGGSAFGGIGSLFSGFTSLFSLFALNEGGVVSSIPSASGGMMLNQITVPSAAGGIHVQESSLSSSIRTGIQNMAASGNVIPFASARVTPSYSGPFGINDGKGGRLAILHPHEMVVPAAETKMILSQIAGSAVSANDGTIMLPSAESGFAVPGTTGAISAKSISLPSRMSSGLSSSITNGHNITAISNDNSSSSTTTGGDTHVHNYSFNVTSLDPRGAHKVIMDNADSVIEAYDRKRRNFGTGGR